MNEKLNHLAETDALTGLYNRRRFQEMLEEAIDEHRRAHDSLSLVLMDIDRFKSLNDEFGHLAGDAALKQVAAVLMENARRHELPARYGGEEFAIILQRCSRFEALIAAERFREAIEKMEWPTRKITASFGVATADDQVASLNDLVSAADQALYLAKVNGRNRVEVYPEGRPVRPPLDGSSLKE
jgi:diguanylate cyclase (GGDEF)-like protein